MSISTHLKDCMVVLEDISFSSGAATLQMLDLSQDKDHMTDSHHTTKSDFLKNLCLLHGITQLMNEKNWMIKLVTNFICVLSSLKQHHSSKNQFILKLLIFFDIFYQKREIWLDKVDKLSSPLNLFNKRTCF